MRDILIMMCANITAALYLVLFTILLFSHVRADDLPESDKELSLLNFTRVGFSNEPSLLNFSNTNEPSSSPASGHAYYISMSTLAFVAAPAALAALVMYAFKKKCSGGADHDTISTRRMSTSHHPEPDCENVNAPLTGLGLKGEVELLRSGRTITSSQRGRGKYDLLVEGGPSIAV